MDFCFRTHYSPLEGESARRGRKPDVAPVGEQRKRLPRLIAQENRKGRGPHVPTAAAGAWRLGCRDSSSRGE